MKRKSHLINIPSTMSGWYICFVKIFCFVFIALQITSCMPVMKVIYGIHNPRYVSDEAVIKFSEKNGLSGKIYRLQDYTEENKKKFRYLGNTMPDIVIFNSKGKLTKYKINCSNKLDSIINLSILNIDEMDLQGTEINEFSNNIYMPFKPDTISFSQLNKPLFVLKFAEYAGKLNKETYPELISQLQLRKDVNYILLNMDYTIK